MKNSVFISIFLSAVFLLQPKTGLTQYSGSLLMLKDNFYSQMINPAYYEKEQVILSLPGLGGASLMSTGNFKFADIAVQNSNGDYDVVFSRLHALGNKKDLLGQTINIPIVYASVPVVGGALSFYWNEHLHTDFSMPGDAYLWLVNDNRLPAHRDADFRLSTGIYWNHEFAVGLTRDLNKKTTMGGRVKLLLNKAYAELDNWNYNIQTSAGGDQIVLTSEGKGYLSAPAWLIKDKRGLVQNIKMKEGGLRPLYTFRNPGIAIDFGMDFRPDKFSRFSFSINNLGYVWLFNDVQSLTQDKVLEYDGLDFSNSVDPNAEGYVHPLDIMLGAKRDLKNAIRPSVDSVQVIRAVSPKTYLHYQYKISDAFSVAAANQTSFNKSYIWNTFSLSGLLSVSNLELAGNLSMHRIESFSYGAGVQWTAGPVRFFVFTDNALALYHPAGQESFSLTFGMNFLLRQRLNWDLFNVSSNRKGKDQDIHLPFYRR